MRRGGGVGCLCYETVQRDELYCYWVISITPLSCSASGGSSRAGKRQAQLPTAVWRPNTTGNGTAKSPGDPTSANFYPIASAAPPVQSRQMLWPANIAGGTQYPEPEGLLPTQSRPGRAAYRRPHTPL